MMPRRVLFALFCALVAAEIALIGLFALSPDHRPPAAGGLDKLFHFAAYATVCATLAAPLRGARARLLAVAAMVLLSVAMEALQPLFPTRTYATADLVAGLSGAVFGGFAVSTGAWMRARCASRRR